MKTKKTKKTKTSELAECREAIAALRKSLRWAMRKVNTYSTNPIGHCASCRQRWLDDGDVRHDRGCPYAVARKLAGLKVKVRNG